MESDFVDRDEDFAELYARAERLSEGCGGAVAFDGVFGMGKTALLGELARRAAARASPLSGCRIVSTRCHSSVGSSVAYGPVADLLLQLVGQKKQPGPFRRLLTATRRGAVLSTPDILSSLVPGLGAVFTVGREVTQAALQTGSLPGDSVLPYQQGAATQIADAILEQARSGPPVLALVDDVQHMDPSSLLVLDRIMESLPTEPLGLVLGHGTGNGSGIQGMDGDVTESSVEALLSRWEMTGLLCRRSLTGLPESAVAELVQRRQAPPGLSVRLSSITRGHPIFVALCLQEWRPQDGAEVALPTTVAHVVESRIGRVSDGDRELLVAGAVQGELFLTLPVAETTGRPHDEVMERLRRIAHSRHLIREAAPPAWAREVGTDCYRFEHRALQQAVYDQQSAQQKRSRHARCAAALVALQGAPSTEALELRLETARHLRSGGPQTRAESARIHYELARSAATDGLSFVEAERHAEQALRDVRELSDGRERDARTVDVVELLLSLTEVRWRGRHEPAGGPDIDALAAEAESAAVRTGDHRLIARTTLLRGKTLLAIRGVEPALEKLRAAVELAGREDDPVALFVARVEYGRQLPKRDLDAGLEQLRLAEELYAADPRLGAAHDPVLQHARNLGEMQLGINLYDSGRLDEARTRLLRCVDRLRDEPLRAEMPLALNYLAQVDIATGREREAADVLREALAFEEERGGDSGWHAYNQALLALLHVRGAHTRDGAREMVANAWLETERTWLINLVPIVRNLYAEVLLEIENEARARGAEPDAAALAEADRLAETTCEETRRTGMIRSEVAAYSLRGRIALATGDKQAAALLAHEAVRLLDEAGPMPALRSEEVFHYAARALRERGETEEAERLGQRARAEVERKSRSLADEADRDRFRATVPLNRAILSVQHL